MIFHEFEGKKLFERYGILIPRGVLVLKGEDAGKAYRTLDKWQVVVKGQTHERGRMERGLIKFCSSPDEALRACEEIWGAGVSAILMEEKLEIAEEKDFSIAFDEALRAPVLEYGSPAGGRGGERERHVLDIHADMDLPSAGFPHIPFAQAFWNLYRREKATSIEVSSLARTSGGEWVALDARIEL